MDNKFIEVCFWMLYGILMTWFLYTVSKESEKKDK